MIQLNPSETFPIIRVLQNPSITETMYVRAVVKNASTLATIATLNLTDNGSRLFSYQYKVPWDNVMARGRYLLITTSVYTDSGYTVRSENYGDEAQTYLVQERFSFGQNYGGGSSGLDEPTIRKILKELLGEALKPLVDLEPMQFPEIPETDLTPVKEKLDYICQELETIPRTVTPATDLKPIQKKLDYLCEEMKVLPRDIPAMDMQPVAEQLKTVGELITAIDNDMREGLGRIEETVASIVAENQEITEFSNKRGGTVTLKAPSSEDKQRDLTLRRLAMKHGIKV